MRGQNILEYLRIGRENKRGWVKWERIRIGRKESRTVEDWKGGDWNRRRKNRR